MKTARISKPKIAVNAKLPPQTPVVTLSTHEINRANVKTMTPRGSDKFIGVEPVWLTQTLNRRAAVIKAFNWYNYSYSKKEAKEFVSNWLTRSGNTTLAKEFRTVSDKHVNITMGWMCRMNTVGLNFTQDEHRRVMEYITAAIARPKKDIKVAEVDETPRVTIQDRLRARANEAAGELEGMLDEFVIGGCKITADYKPITVLRDMNVAPQMVSTIAAIWKGYITEWEAVDAGRDAQLVEGHSNFSKTQVRNLIKFGNLVTAACGDYVQIKKMERKPSKRKAVSPEKQAAKFKHMREFPQLKLTSLPAAKLVNAAEAYLYHVKKRKLIHVVADSHAGSFTVKNNSVIGFSTAESVQKTLRRPEEQIRVLMQGGRPVSRKIFKDIKSTETRFNGRGTAEIMILKCW